MRETLHVLTVYHVVVYVQLRQVGQRPRSAPLWRQLSHIHTPSNSEQARLKTVSRGRMQATSKSG